MTALPLALVAVAIWLISRSSSSVADDFDRDVAAILAELEAQGFEPLIWREHLVLDECRTQAEQSAYLEAGTSWTGQSAHLDQDGDGRCQARDIVDGRLDPSGYRVYWGSPLELGWDDTRAAMFEAHATALGVAAMARGLTWGGNWTGDHYDPAHIEAA